jgi:hypothetical protein
MQKLGSRRGNFISENICFKISVQCCIANGGIAEIHLFLFFIFLPVLLTFEVHVVSLSIAWRQEKPDLKVKHMSVAKKAFKT